MPEYLPVAKAGVLSVGSLKQVFVGDQELLLMNVAGKICATQGTADTCICISANSLVMFCSVRFTQQNSVLRRGSSLSPMSLRLINN